jgi:microsomal dipeptidase-like Zn-dependent dipeptidase
MHCHYPMHLLGEDRPPSHAFDHMVRKGRRPRWLDRFRAWLLRRAAERINYRDEHSGWRVTFDGLENGRTRVVFSVLYEPFAEIDFDELPGSDPEEGYFADLMDHLTLVEDELKRIDPGNERHVRVRTAADLDSAIETGRLAFVPCVEGAFHLGRTPEAIEANVAELARRGCGYITLAHLFYRGIATNANALPFVSEGIYDRFFCQPRNRPLSKLGVAAIRAMYDHRVLIDLSHARPDSVHATLDLLDELDAERGADPKDYPVISSHAGYRFGKQKYMHDDRAIERIAARDGVIGLIFARHQLQDGRADGEGLDHTIETLTAHIDKIRAAAGSNAHVGIGSDLDGFIKPTMSGVEAIDDLALVDERLHAAYPDDGEAITSQNAIRVLRRVLAQRPTAA